METYSYELTKRTIKIFQEDKHVKSLPLILEDYVDDILKQGNFRT